MEIDIRGRSALIDDDDFERVSKLAWWVTPQGYAVAKPPSGSRKRKTISMHRLVINAPPGSEVDHINRNKLDNRKCNLRLCTHSENCRNKGKRRGCSSQHRGVSWNKRKGAWQVVIRVNGRLKWGGWFTSEDDAAKAAAPHFAGIAP